MCVGRRAVEHPARRLRPYRPHLARPRRRARVLAARCERAVAADVRLWPSEVERGAHHLRIRRAAGAQPGLESRHVGARPAAARLVDHLRLCRRCQRRRCAVLPGQSRAAAVSGDRQTLLVPRGGSTKSAAPLRAGARAGAVRGELQHALQQPARRRDGRLGLVRLPRGRKRMGRLSAGGQQEPLSVPHGRPADPPLAPRSLEPGHVRAVSTGIAPSVSGALATGTGAVPAAQLVARHAQPRVDRHHQRAPVVVEDASSYRAGAVSRAASARPARNPSTLRSLPRTESKRP